MQLKLSCYKCGSVDFERAPQPCYEIEGRSYLLHEDVPKAKVICSKCGLEDYAKNLVIKYE